MFEKYTEAPRVSEEYLRLTVPLMKRLGVAPNPANYALFYAYVAGRNKELQAELGELVKCGERITRTQCEMLYRKYFVEYVDDKIERFQSSSKKILGDVHTTLQHADGGASDFGNSLENYKNQLEQTKDGGNVHTIIDGMLAETRQMQRSQSDLQQQLQASTVEIMHLKKELQNARQEALVDPLTQLANRKGFSNALADAIAQMDDGDAAPCLLMLDIDHFKQVNDTFGHLVGDQVLRMVAMILKKCIKGKDTPCRYGGEEFAIVLPDTPLEGAYRLAEVIRKAVSKGKIQRTRSQETVGQVTISIGVAGYRQGEAEEQFVRRADAALYESKQGGRNRVTIEQ